MKSKIIKLLAVFMLLISLAPCIAEDCNHTYFETDVFQEVTPKAIPSISENLTMVAKIRAECLYCKDEVFVHSPVFTLEELLAKGFILQTVEKEPVEQPQQRCEQHFYLKSKAYRENVLIGGAVYQQKDFTCVLCEHTVQMGYPVQPAR